MIIDESEESEESNDSQLIPFNNRSELSFLDGFPSIGIESVLVQSNDFVNYYNGDSAPLLLNSNLLPATSGKFSAHAKYIK